MRAGELTHKVMVQRPTETQDAFGEPVRTWTDIAQVWASVEYEGGNETLDGVRHFAEVPVEIEIRRSKTTHGVREKDRVLIPGATTTLRSFLNGSTTALVINDTSALPPENEFIVRVDDELMVVSAGTGTSSAPYTVTRGRFGTSAVAHLSDTSVVHMAPVDIVSVSPSRYSMRLVGLRSEVRST